jgi:hypothetical protein
VGLYSVFKPSLGMEHRGTQQGRRSLPAWRNLRRQLSQRFDPAAPGSLTIWLIRWFGARLLRVPTR